MVNEHSLNISRMVNENEHALTVNEYVYGPIFVGSKWQYDISKGPTFSTKIVITKPWF